MIVITIHRTGAKNENRRTYVQSVVSEDPTPGTWGSHQLLLAQYRELDEEWLANMPANKLKQVFFNIKFLRAILYRHGELHCEYCGKPNLILFGLKKKPNKKTMATVDHFLPKSKYPHLAFSRNNLLVCCNTCNHKKDDNEWPSSKVKFPYPEHVHLYRK